MQFAVKCKNYVKSEQLWNFEGYRKQRKHSYSGISSGGDQVPVILCLFRLPGCQVARLPGCQVTRLPGYQVTRLPGYQVTRLPGYQVTRLPGYQVTRLPGYRKQRKHSYSGISSGGDQVPVILCLFKHKEIYLLEL